ncbi:PFL family protein [Effusibacillus pohliae]|uniref:PFL family protein n=1 Tax=Effusibacillus pohliae TaxID=232270 RepID=UPI00036B930D|nr:PFL family protein [Effusibacillus pohliae]
MSYTESEVLETIRMVETEHLDIRTVTLGVHLDDCRADTLSATKTRVRDKLLRHASRLVPVVHGIEREIGIPIVNKRIAVTPIAHALPGFDKDGYVEIAVELDEVAEELGIDFLGGYSALVHKGMTPSAQALIDSLPDALSQTNRVCASVAVASTKAGINMDAVYRMGCTIKHVAERTADRSGIGAAKLVVFCNPVDDNPFMAGAFHGFGEPDAVINVGVSGPGVVLSALERLEKRADFGMIAETIKRTAFKITRVGELVGRKTAAALGVPFGIVDLSLAPTNAMGDSVAQILEAMGLERCGAHGTTAALALLNDAVKKGGAMATSYPGGLSGAFIPVSEDNGMIAAVEAGALSLAKLEAMTCVCSVGLDMIAVPGETTAETLAGLIADEMAIGMMNKKTTAVRVIPVPGAVAGQMAEFGGLLGRAPVMEINRFSSAEFARRGGRIPAPIQSLMN